MSAGTYRHVEFFYQINQFELVEKVLHHGGGSCRIHQTILLPEIIAAEGAFDVI